MSQYGSYHEYNERPSLPALEVKTNPFHLTSSLASQIALLAHSACHSSAQYPHK